jgi:acyl dehydratase
LAPVRIGDTVTVIVIVAELVPEKSRARLTCCARSAAKWCSTARLW